MNTDGEWNDARQAQFATTLAEFYELTGKFMYLERAVASARASFALMAIMENRDICPENYLGTGVFFEIHGGSAENYGHGGYDSRNYQSGFHWGTGSALVTASQLIKRYGDIFIDIKAHKGIGIDSAVVRSLDIKGPEISMEIEALNEKEEFLLVIKGEDPADYNISMRGYNVVKTEKSGNYKVKRIVI